ncbi:hypothetical protein INT80_03340 [Gallibacterium anatis]|uniref:Alanyl-tRNA synthetase class IIc N-terminal domain-containing protein n=1 Tax=Gallibacterium anatis TaxID=750 RepID=A0A930UUA1_9PAST|nr:hypothetical protein [Gallibacterium anatis]
MGILTSPQWLGLLKEKLWVTAYETDEEAYNIWHQQIGVPADRIVRIGDNKGAHLTLPITSGRWATPVLAVLVPKFSTITVITFGVALRVLLKKTATAISKPGISSCVQPFSGRHNGKNCRNRLLIPEWAWNVSVPYCNTLTPTMILIFSKP